MTEPVLAWHFAGDKLRNGRPVPPDGTTLHFYGDLTLCKAGLHASLLALDALRYASGPICRRVRCAGEIIVGSRMVCCRARTILWRVDAEDVLWRFARWCALDVANAWHAPQVVREYLATGDETLGGAARRAVRAAEWSPFWGGMGNATRDAAWDAAADAAWDAAWDAVLDAPWDLIWLVARDAAMHAAGAAGDTAWERYNAELERMLLEAHNQDGGVLNPALLTVDVDEGDET